jgi:hypothetical protein
MLDMGVEGRGRRGAGRGPASLGAAPLPLWVCAGRAGSFTLAGLEESSMAMKRLSAAEMISLSDPLVDKEHPEHALLESMEDARPALKRLTVAHAAILHAQPTIDLGELGKLQDEAAKLDGEHDDVVRGIVAVISGFAHLARDGARKTALLQLRDALFPTGGAIIARSYREEAGQAVLLKSRLTAPMKALLKSLPAPDGNLLKELEGYFRTAKKLGEVEDAKSGATSGHGATPAEMLAARNLWVRSMNALVAAIELADEVPEGIAAIVERLRKAEATADQRAANGGHGGDEEDQAAADVGAKDEGTAPVKANGEAGAGAGEAKKSGGKGKGKPA